MKIIANISKDSFTIRAKHISESLLNKLQVSSCCTMLSCPSENESKGCTSKIWGPREFCSQWE